MNSKDNLNSPQINVEEKNYDDYYDNFIKTFVPNTKKRYVFKFFKRLFDIVASLILLILLFPLMLVIGIAIKIDSKGPVIFAQERMGKNCKTFKCYKFRSMRTNAPKDRATSLLNHPETYYTKVGRFLRATSLDELPQLWNCLFGTMSLIGYRPLCLTEVNCNEMRKQLNVFSMRPGISGYAQIHGRDNVYYKNKAILDAIYVKKATLWLDFKLIIQTFIVVLRRDGNADGKKKNKKPAPSTTASTVVNNEKE